MDLNEKSLHSANEINLARCRATIRWGSPVIDRTRCRSPGFSLGLEGRVHFRVLIDPSGPKNVGRVEVSSRPFLLHRLIRVVSNRCGGGRGQYS